MNGSKFLNNKNSNNKFKNILNGFITKVLICSIIFVVLLILVKSNPNIKKTINDKFYNNDFSFAKINSLYKKYFGKILPFDNVLPNDEVVVFDEKIKYNSISLYKDGAKLNVSTGYLVPTLESGIVVYIGEKENYGNTVVVQQINGIDVWYGNVNSSSIKLYDYIEKGTLLGETKDNKLYLVFQKNGVFLDYKEYI